MKKTLNPCWLDASYEECTWEPERGYVRWTEISKRNTDDEVIYTLLGSNGKERELRYSKAVGRKVMDLIGKIPMKR